MDSGGFKWIQVDSGGFKWIHVDSRGFKWIQMDSGGFKWIQMDSSGFKWSNMKSRKMISYFSEIHYKNSILLFFLFVSVLLDKIFISLSK